MKPITLTFLLFLCTSGVHFNALAKTDREKLEAQILAITSDLTCERDEQCKSFGFGSRPCGGYQQYKLYSTRVTDEKTLLDLAAAFLKQDKEFSKNTTSICSVEAPLTAACIKGHCVPMGDVANTITPIHYAASKNDIALITALLKQGYSINGLSAMHETPLIYSVQIKNIEPATIKFLLDHGADPNFRYGNQASTALIFAVTSNRPEIVEILLEHKADPLLANHWGNAVDYAKNMGHTKILAMLNK